MKLSRFFERQAGRSLAAFGIITALVVSAFVPIIASAEQLTERSIALSSSSQSAEDVTYTVNFTATSDAAAFVVDFCSDSPTVGVACGTPTGMVVTGATAETAGFTATGTGHQIVVDGTIDVSTLADISVEISGITNPSTVGPLYARIVTFTTTTAADAYTSTAPGDDADVVDQGGLALSITNTIGVSAGVLESMTFCVANQVITKDCGNAATTGHEPTLKLGESAGNTVALTPNLVSSGDLYTQISTNAVSGAVVSLKSSTIGCGGLVRAGAPGSCDILPALAGDIAAGQAKFGVKTGPVTDSATVTGTGTLRAANGSAYNDTTYTLNYVTGDASGITGPFGDPFLDTNDAPINNKNMQITFGASISNDTPAGNYSADLSMIATGKF